MSLKPASELAQELILLFFLARRKAKYYPSQIVLTNSSWELRTLRKKSDVNNFLTISSAKIPLIPFSNSEISQLRRLHL